MELSFLMNVLALFISVPIVTAQQTWATGQSVATTSGRVTGMASPKIPTVSQYMGIPFAQPPVGPNRWVKPLDFNGTAEIKATKQAASCRGPMAFMSGSNVSEDCLYLNLWTAPQKGEAKKAVMFFVYGGGFETGSTAGMDGSRLADREDVVVVLPGYRVGIYGFPDGPGLPDQNLGILDVRKALEWVRDNIANFGGDPNRVMMFGQSAGSMLIDMYTLAYPSEPLMHAAIGESGSATSGFALDNKGAKFAKVAQALGCGSGPASVDCLRKKSDADIIKAVGNAGRSGIAGPFAPVVDKKVVWSNSEANARAKQGLFAKVPYVFMANSKEVGIGDAQVFNCPASQAAAARTANGILAWRVRFYGAGTSGHGAELPYVFGSKAGALSDYVMKTWAGFAKNPKDYLIKEGWPTYKIGGQLVRIGYQTEVKASTESTSVTDSGCRL